MQRWSTSNPSDMISDKQKKEIRRFADRITPKSWHVIIDSEQERISPGVLNICIRIQGPESEIYTDPLGNKCYPYESRDGAEYYYNVFGRIFERIEIKPILGMVSGRMIFKDLKSYGADGRGKVARITILLWPYLGDWKGTLLHELAHVAVYRYRAFRIKNYRKEDLFHPHWNMNPQTALRKRKFHREGHHGPMFQQAFATLAKRAVREFGTEIPPNDLFWITVRNELKRYKKRTIHRSLRFFETG